MTQALAAPLFASILVPAFTLWGSPVTWLEIVAFVLSIAMVLCNFRVNPWAWPLAIVASALYGLLFASSRLYGEATLQLLFITVAFWGWWQWLRGRGADGAPLRVHVLPAATRWRIGALTLAAWPLLGWVLDRYTDSDVPYLDALPTVGSITGQFLLGRKLVENWPVWLLVNLFSVGLFAVKALWLTMLLYAIFAVLSAVGWRLWQSRAA
jgi:nicotinamide mononucleotide transporter